MSRPILVRSLQGRRVRRWRLHNYDDGDWEKKKERERVKGVVLYESDGREKEGRDSMEFLFKFNFILTTSLFLFFPFISLFTQPLVLISCANRLCVPQDLKKRNKWIVQSLSQGMTFGHWNIDFVSPAFPSRRTYNLYVCLNSYVYVGSVIRYEHSLFLPFTSIWSVCNLNLKKKSWLKQHQLDFCTKRRRRGR